MTELEVITSSPLDEGDRVGFDTLIEETLVVPDGDTEFVLVAVPRGKGLLFQAWLQRQTLAAGNFQPRETAAFDG